MNVFSRIPSEGVRAAPILLVLMACAMLASGFWALNESFLTPLREGWRMRDWVSTPGVIDDVSLRAANGKEIPVLGGPGVDPALKEAAMPSGVVKLKVKYHYYVGEQSYDGTRFGLHQSLDDGDAQRHAAAHLYRKQEVTVWVNPKNPAEAVLDRNLHWGVMLVAIPAAAIAGVGLLILFIGAKTWWQMRKIARQMKALGRPH